MKSRMGIAGAFTLSFACGVALWMFASAQTPAISPEAVRLQEARNLGKAFYETPGSSRQAVEQLRMALDLNPGSAREHLNYGLALLRAGEREEGIAQIIEAQRIDRSLPHTYFNLGIEFKKAGEAEKAIDQLLQMERLRPLEAKTQYNLGALYKQIGNTRRAIEKFERTIELDPSLAAPHFQLFGILRRTELERATRELEIFKGLKEATEDAAVGEDVDWSFYSELYDPSLATGDAAPAVPYKFATHEVARLDGGALGALSLDLNGDGSADAIAWSAESAVALVGGDSAGPEVAPLVLAGESHYAAGDFDSDGLADLCRVDDTGVEVLRNAGGRMFRSVFAEAGGFDLCLFADYDHDNDYDLFALGRDKRLFRNDGEGSLADVSSDFPFGDGRVRAAATAELFEDNGHDLIAVYGDGVSVHQDRKLGVFDQAVEIQGATAPAGSVRLEVVDANHDGYLDVAVTGRGVTLLLENHEGDLRPGPAMDRVEAWADFELRGRVDAATEHGVQANRGGFEFGVVDSSDEPPPGFAVSGDFDADGRPDLLAAGPGGAIRFAANRTETANRGVTVRLEGVKSPAIAAGSRVELKAGFRYAKHVYLGTPLHFGLGPAESFDTIRVTWPNGLIQNELAEEPVAEVRITEAPRLSGSCPMVFTWNGHRFEYISEVLGVAPLGASLARGTYFPVDHTEFVSIRGDQLRERDGHLDVRLTEELREVAYVDKIRLIAVDHPGDIRIVTSEKAKGPPFPDFRLYGVASAIKPVAATNHHGEDVLARIVSGDRRYAEFERDYQNRAERHSLTLEFPRFDSDDAVLFLEGWVDWSSASSIVAASQTKNSALQPPYLEVLDKHGDWVTAVADVGLPGGTLRTIAVDLRGVIPSGSRAMRLTTNMCVYWDSAYIGLGTTEPEARLTHLSPTTSRLRFRGFSRNYIADGRAQPERFDYQEVSSTTNWNPTPGRYTRFGDVRELLDREDDRLVIMGAGDEIELRFPSGGLPPLAVGWTRDYLLFVDGWAKENEANTAFGDSVTPLPFHSMSGYPYGPGETYPDTPEHRADLERYHTRRAMRLLRPLVARSAPR
ncbi:MAG: ASPIC/UnbV domain-containing protein [Bryobacterales bacterium]|nr:ASPIC/UnbV domain-containing protein [Bryobacterales bacterium]